MMDPGAMAPFGEALKSYCNGNLRAGVVVRRDDGVAAPLPISHFFREPSSFSRIECEALKQCRGHVLDAGAGAGLHTLELQRRGEVVTALDICPDAVEVMARRGVKEAVQSDIFTFVARKFDTLLLLGHGIGMMESIAGLDRFLAHADELLSPGGQILLDSMDPAVTTDAGNLAYHAANRRAGRYIGEVRMCFEFEGKAGPYCGWLHVDPGTLRDRAAEAGWSSTAIIQESNGEFLARIKKRNM